MVIYRGDSTIIIGLFRYIIIIICEVPTNGEDVRYKKEANEKLEINS